ncbi:hypothetical protein HanOQP8_Chr16g0608701 [Helianthus annuus]|nr:hypothetical protein HanOQP8_Chr16g0608701 [Helianthus annuus]
MLPPLEPSIYADAFSNVSISSSVSPSTITKHLFSWSFFTGSNPPKQEQALDSSNPTATNSFGF